jgi:hypothetical protein
VIIWYYAFQDFRPLVVTALSGGGVDPASIIVWGKAGMPCLFLAPYEAIRWKPLNSAIRLPIRLWLVLAAIFLALTLGKQFGRASQSQGGAGKAAEIGGLLGGAGGHAGRD